MLQIVLLDKPQQKIPILKDFNPNQQTWLVSELKTKLEIQGQIITAQGFFEDTSIMRASELWRLIHRRARPDWRLISRDFFQTWIRDKLKASSSSDLSANADQVILKFMDHLAPILTHPDGISNLRDWLLEKPDSFQHWGEWLLIAESLFSGLRENKILPSSWAVHSLQNILNVSDYWSRPLIVDLGCNLSKTEAEFFRTLGESIDVTVLQPHPNWREKFRYLLAPYQLFEGKNSRSAATIKSTSPSGSIESTSPSGSISSNSSSVRSQNFRCSGPLAEVKLATQTIRTWIEAGIAPQKIALVAPEIEEYWPWVSAYFEEEGIPLNKDKVGRLHTKPLMANWLANLRLYSGKVQYADLEQSYFGSSTDGKNFSQNHDGSKLLRFEKFHGLFSQLIDADDLARWQTISSSYQAKVSSNALLSRDEFVGYALGYWPRESYSESQVSELEPLLRDLLSETLERQKLKLGSWLFYLEQLAAKKEFILRAGEASGVQIQNLSSIEAFWFEKIFFLGLTESQMKERYQGLLKVSEVMDIAEDLGFYLDHPEMSSKAFDLEWVADAEVPFSAYSTAATGFSGGAEAPASFWIKQEKQETVPLTAPMDTRWNSIEASQLVETLPKLRGLDSEVVELQAKAIETESTQSFPRIDLDIKPEINPADQKDSAHLKAELASERIHKAGMSISAIESYLDCPFKFAAQKIFQLKDEAVVDVETDRRSLGVLEHALLEELCVEPRTFDWSPGEIGELLEKIRQKKALHFFDQNVWEAQKTKFIRKAQRFLEIERQFSLEFPDAKVLGRELPIRFQFKVESGEFVPLRGDERSEPGDQDSFGTVYTSSATTPINSSTGGILFTGKIDRVDGLSDNKEIVVLDYKASVNGIYALGSWLNKNQLQLLFYCLALDSGVAEKFSASEVVGAFYYDLKSMEKLKGMRLTESSGKLFSLESRSRDKISSEAKEKLYSELKQRISEVLKLILAGSFPALPNDKTDCPKCEWNRLCRAPHLK